MPSHSSLGSARGVVRVRLTLPPSTLAPSLLSLRPTWKTDLRNEDAEALLAIIAGLLKGTGCSWQLPKAVPELSRAWKDPGVPWQRQSNIAISPAGSIPEWRREVAVRFSMLYLVTKGPDAGASQVQDIGEENINPAPTSPRSACGERGGMVMSQSEHSVETLARQAFSLVIELRDRPEAHGLLSKAIEVLKFLAQHGNTNAPTLCVSVRAMRFPKV